MQANDTYGCFRSTLFKHIFTAWFAVYLLFLPLFLYVLYVGYDQRRNRRSGFVSSHSDVFTFHMVALELCSIVFSSLYCASFYTGLFFLAVVGVNVVSLTLVGQALFHCLTCVERYVAVVHPVTYLRLKTGGGVTVRNISIGCVWILSFGHTCLTNADSISFVYKLTSAWVLGVLSLTVTGFCSFSIICVLIRPGPGEGGGDRRTIDQSKRSAFETVVTIQAMLLLRFMVLLIISALKLTLRLTADTCVIAISGLWFGLPSSSVLPLLFLHRAGKLTCLKMRK